MKTIVGFLLLALIALQYKLWLGDGNFFQWRQLEKQRIAQEYENKRLIQRNRVLQADIIELKSGEQALEEEARYELGMIKEGEVYYHFAD